jgi:hypothetical protein
MSLYDEFVETPPSETHPPSKLRLERLRDYASSLCVNDHARSQLFCLPKSLEFLFGEVREVILKQSSVQMERARQTANMVREKFDKLLEACASTIIPDYRCFKNEVSTMFSKYPSFAVCAAIASSMDNIECHLQKLSQQDPSQRDRVTCIVAYHKYKLLINFLYLTPLPLGVNEAIESKRKTRTGVCSEFNKVEYWHGNLW